MKTGLIVTLLFLSNIAITLAQTTEQDAKPLDFDPTMITHSFNTLITGRLNNFKVSGHVDMIKKAWENGKLGFSIEFINEQQFKRYQEKDGINLTPFILGHKLMVAVSENNIEKVQALIDPAHPDHEAVSRGLDAVLVALEMIFERKDYAQRAKILERLAGLSKISGEQDREKMVMEIFTENFSSVEAVMFAGFFIYRFKQIHPESNISDDLSAIMDSNKTRLDQILLHAFLGGPDPWVSQPPPASNNYDETYPDYQQD